MLHATPTRRALLADIRAGEVYTEAGQAWCHRTGRKVTAALVAMIVADWVVLIPDPRPGRNRAWLTAAGYRALDGAR